MGYTIRRWTAVAVTAWMVVAATGVGGAQIGAPHADSTAESVVVLPDSGVSGEGPKAETREGGASNGRENGGE